MLFFESVYDNNSYVSLHFFGFPLDGNRIWMLISISFLNILLVFRIVLLCFFLWRKFLWRISLISAEIRIEKLTDGCKCLGGKIQKSAEIRIFSQ